MPSADWDLSWLSAHTSHVASPVVRASVRPRHPREQPQRESPAGKRHPSLRPHLWEVTQHHWDCSEKAEPAQVHGGGETLALGKSGSRPPLKVELAPPLHFHLRPQSCDFTLSATARRACTCRTLCDTGCPGPSGLRPLFAPLTPDLSPLATAPMSSQPVNSSVALDREAVSALTAAELGAETAGGTVLL